MEIESKMMMNTYRMNTKKIYYFSVNKFVCERIKQLFDLLDDIVLEKTISDLHILSKNFLCLLDKDKFNDKLSQINMNDMDFIKLHQIFYILIKSKYFQLFDNFEEISIFISKILINYINNGKDKFYYVMDKIPMFFIYKENIDKLWEKYNDYLIYFIVMYVVFPFIINPIFNHSRICSNCGKMSDVTFVRCYECRMFNYCSNICQSKNRKDHKKICPEIFNIFQ